jgi:UPF0716 protein FxsA
MPVFPVFAVLFFVVPFIEIWLLIKVGGIIGAFPTILLVVLTAVLGAAMLRQQGLATLARFQQNLQNGQLPANEILEGVVLLVGGVLLMTPGFFTDAMGFLCLFPLSRKLILKILLSRSQVFVQSSTTTHYEGGVFRQSSSSGTYSRDIEGEVVSRQDDSADK